MKVSIHQPNFLPYPGYFNKIKESDIFVIYDTAQYVKDRWDNRNKIRTKEDSTYLTIPLDHKESFTRQFYKIPLPKNGIWKKKHLKTLHANYKNSTYFNEIFEFISSHYESDCSMFSTFNIRLIKFIINKLEISTKIILASNLELDISKKSTDQLVSITNKVGANCYLSGASGKKYLDSDRFRKEGLKIEFQNYKIKPYRQRFDGFIPNLSTIDILFNHGPSSKDFI
mgnify:CR=1 FL=1|tara:strand:+ start:63 stop:743 length:681 start_codon:yes stop_codon:yes gene_type:complete